MTIARSIARPIASPIASRTPIIGGGGGGTIQGSFTVSDQTPDAGDSVTFTMTLTSTPVGSYSIQLTRNNANVSGATSSPWVITNWQIALDGDYRWVVTDSGNSEVRTFGPRSVVTADPPVLLGIGSMAIGTTFQVA